VTTVTETLYASDAELLELRDKLSTMKIRQQVSAISEYVLRIENATSKQSLRNTEQIWQRAQALSLPYTGERNTFGSYLSDEAKDSASAIVSTGKGRGGGYYLSALAAQVAKDEAKPTTEEPSPTNQGEQALYPVLREWFTAREYQSRVTASMRALGKWSNPDIVALSATEHLGRLEVEIATIEAKVNLAQWEYWFFEAVSHRRFANRAYFAFPLPESLAEKLPKELRYMCELYRVGALVLIIPDSEYGKLQAGSLTEELTLETVGVQEVYSAPWNLVPLEYQRRFCEALEIKDLAGLFTWGSVA
jgi:hypothetical protein